ncbi:ferric reductase-like transmembrane domain-containing protein [Brevibacillus reuszeri]|uniref:ferric reductase-like transmembrane domain-containing protein n=1 Tax=Brevibacillus reuszeri TaxID=54915 RepID=UPI003D22A5FE
MRLFWSRFCNHVLCLLLLAATARWLWPDFGAFPPMETWSMILGYLSLVLIGATLVIGPIKSWLPASWQPVSLSLRRDIGIWAGLTGFLHVLLVLVLFQGTPRLMILNDTNAPKAGGWLKLFFVSNHNGNDLLIPNWSMTGIANYMGLTAFCILLALWLTSSRRAEKWLGGSSWKRLHLANFTLFLLVVFHALIYIHSIKGKPHSAADFLWLAAVVLLIRLVCFITTAVKRKRGKTTSL